ncbi:MAG: hypothetical protein Q4B85_06215 [Lachnospiraceae bacterium]|nr:hypothetical protein [Lachnospiraceae bacterium]
MILKKCLLLFFLGANALQDLRKREILLLPTVLYGFCTLWLVLLTMGEPGELLLSLLPGVLLLLLSVATAGAVGLGDVWITLILGLQLGLLGTMELLSLTGVLLLIVAVLPCNRGKGKELPLVPFLFLALLLQPLF